MTTKKYNWPSSLEKRVSNFIFVKLQKMYMNVQMYKNKCKNVFFSLSVNNDAHGFLHKMIWHF